MSTQQSAPTRTETTTESNQSDLATARRIQTIRFGDVDVPSEEIMTFPKGILGFEQYREYVVIESPDSDPFKWLQSMDEPDLAFVVVNPLVFFPDYHIDVDRQELQELKITATEAVEVYVIVSVPDGDLTRMSANLQGPLILNVEKQLAKQLVLATGGYKIAHRLIDQSAAQESESQKRKSPASGESRKPGRR